MTPKPPSPPLVPPSSEVALDPDGPPSQDEIAASEALRRALEDPEVPNGLADLARAAALAHAPRAIDPFTHRRIVDGALARRRPRGGRVIRVSFGIGAGLALAAGVALVVGSLADPSTQGVATLAERPPLIQARSTQPLFDEPFVASPAPMPGHGSSRIDRIAMARASDFRENEFSRWGAR